MRNEKGFIGIIAILIVVIIAAIWMAYLLKNDWLGVPDITGNSKEQKAVPAQLDDLRAQMKDVQQNQDKKIYDAMGEAGQKAQDILDK